MKKPSKYVVYKISFNTPTEKYTYVGYTTNIDRRLKEHLRDHRRPVARLLNASVGKVKVEILDQGNNLATVLVSESHYIAKTVRYNRVKTILNKYHNKNYQRRNNRSVVL